MQSTKKAINLKVTYNKIHTYIYLHRIEALVKPLISVEQTDFDNKRNID